jgi:hypothetical protein
MTRYQGERMMQIAGKLTILILVSSVSMSALATRALAQKGESGEPVIEPLAEVGYTEDAPPEQTPSAPAPQKAAADPGEGWHFVVAPYLWFAGMHGSVGARGYDASVHGSFGDIFSYLNIGIMVAAEPRYKKFGAPVDFLWNEALR